MNRRVCYNQAAIFARIIPQTMDVFSAFRIKFASRLRRMILRVLHHKGFFTATRSTKKCNARVFLFIYLFKYIYIYIYIYHYLFAYLLLDYTEQPLKKFCANSRSRNSHY
eukprot:gene4236-3060_t